MPDENDNADVPHLDLDDIGPWIDDVQDNRDNNGMGLGGTGMGGMGMGRSYGGGSRLRAVLLLTQGVDVVGRWVWGWGWRVGGTLAGRFAERFGWVPGGLRVLGANKWAGWAFPGVRSLWGWASSEVQDHQKDLEEEKAGRVGRRGEAAAVVDDDGLD